MKKLTVAGCIALAAIAVCGYFLFANQGYSAPAHSPKDGFGLAGDVLGESQNEFTKRHSRYDFHFHRKGEIDPETRKPTPWLMVKHFPVCGPGAEKDETWCVIGFAEPFKASGIPVKSAQFYFTKSELTQIQAYLRPEDILDFRSYLATQYGPPTGENAARGQEIYGKEMDVSGAWSGVGHICIGKLKDPPMGYVIVDGGALRSASEWKDYFGGILGVR